MDTTHVRIKQFILSKKSIVLKKNEWSGSSRCWWLKTMKSERFSCRRPQANFNCYSIISFFLLPNAADSSHNGFLLDTWKENQKMSILRTPFITLDTLLFLNFWCCRKLGNFLIVLAVCGITNKQLMQIGRLFAFFMFKIWQKIKRPLWRVFKYCHFMVLQKCKVGQKKRIK